MGSRDEEAERHERIKHTYFNATPAALQAVARAGERLELLYRRHLGGDWGEGQDASEWQENDHARENGGTTLSIFILSTGEQLWVATDTYGTTRAVTEDEYR